LRHEPAVDRVDGAVRQERTHITDLDTRRVRDLARGEDIRNDSWDG
jgi:hypothetical protein